MSGGFLGNIDVSILWKGRIRLKKGSWESDALQPFFLSH